MDSASLQFVLFGLAAVLASNISRSVVWRSSVLMLASAALLLVLAQRPAQLLPLAGFLMLGYFALMLLQRGRNRFLVWSILAVIFAYVWLKKYTFLPEGMFLRSPYFILGLSYIFFRVLHLLIEADGSEERRVGLGGYLLYTINFTTLLSGPIQRYDEFARDQFAQHPIALGPRVIGLQLERIVRGFFKVNVLGTMFHAMQDDALAQLFQPLPLTGRLFAATRLAVIYPLFLYCNFSGYIDIVIALARLMRLRLPENFDRPFSACSVLEFWTRWHMTLSNWLKTYVYNPLLIALMRRISSVELQPLLGVLCFFVTFFLIGIWHGRTSEFVVFGILQGSGVAIDKLWQLGLTRFMGRKGYQSLARNGIYASVGRGLNYAWFSFTLIWFWADWKQIKGIFAALPSWQWLGVWLTVCLAATVTLALWERLRYLLLSIRTSAGPILINRYARVIFASALGLGAFYITGLLDQPAPGIVYKAF
jgi:D-alanyl-lipoteichoic acid acyltransferase DltB (MBOAT superfamily)